MISQLSTAQHSVDLSLIKSSSSSSRFQHIEWWVTHVHCLELQVTQQGRTTKASDTYSMGVLMW
jgi:hypothetical protein